MARLLVLLVRTVSIAQNYVLLLHFFVAENNATPDHLGIGHHISSGSHVLLHLEPYPTWMDILSCLQLYHAFGFW